MEKEGLDPNMTKGNVLLAEEVPTLQVFGLGNMEGGVGADIILSAELLTKFERILSGEFQIESTSDTAELCVDERHEINAAPRNSARSAGGPVGNAHAHDLAVGNLNENEDELAVVSSASKKQQAAGANVLPHTDDHSSCGCGQCMKASLVYETIAKNIDNVSAAVNALSGVSSEKGLSSPSITSEDALALSNKAQLRLNQQFYFAEDRASVLAAATGPEGKIEMLTGPHDAQVALWVSTPGKTEDVKRISDELGINCFVANPWSFRKTAESLNVTGYEGETTLTEKALATLNVATLSVLCSNKMPVLVV